MVRFVCLAGMCLRRWQRNGHESARRVSPYSGLLRHCARNWGVHEARLGSCVGPVGGHDREAAPHMRLGVRSGVFNDRRSARGMAPQVDGATVMSARRGQGR